MANCPTRRANWPSTTAHASIVASWSDSNAKSLDGSIRPPDVRPCGAGRLLSGGPVGTAVASPAAMEREVQREPEDFLKVGSRTELAELLDRYGEPTLQRAITALGPDVVIEHVLGLMRARFRPPTTARIGNVRWRLRHDGSTVTCWFGVQPDRSFVGALGEPPRTRITVETTLAAFIRYLGNRLDLPWAFVTGKVRVRGDLTFIPAVRSWFPDE